MPFVVQLHRPLRRHLTWLVCLILPGPAALTWSARLGPAALAPAILAAGTLAPTTAALAVGATATLVLPPALLAQSDETGFSPLFDGRTLAGWEGDEQVFHVVDGALVGGSLERSLDRNQFLCTRSEYANFELRLQFKLTGQGVNGGVQFRSQRIPNDTEVRGYQADLGDGYWGSLYDESRRNRILAAAAADTVARALRRDDWNDYTIRCEGRRIQLWINDQPTVDYTESDTSLPQQGIVGLQIHAGGPSQAAYRNLRLKKLD